MRAVLDTIVLYVEGLEAVMCLLTSNKYGRKWDPGVQVVEIEVCKFKGHGHIPTQIVQKALVRVEYLLQTYPSSLSAADRGA